MCNFLFIIINYITLQHTDNNDDDDESHYSSITKMIVLSWIVE